MRNAHGLSKEGNVSQQFPMFFNLFYFCPIYHLFTTFINLLNFCQTLSNSQDTRTSRQTLEKQNAYYEGKL